MRPSSPPQVPVRMLIMLCSLLAAGCAQAQLFGGKQYVRMTVGPAQSAPGKPFDLLVTLDIDRGFHIQANKPAPGYIATVVKITAPKGFKTGSAVFPAPITAKVAGESLPVFEGRVVVRIPVTPPKGAAGAQKFTAQLHYQACNAESCFPPTDLNGSGTVVLGGKKKGDNSGASPVIGQSGNSASPAPASGPAVSPIEGYTLSKIEAFVPAAKFINFLHTGSTAGDAATGRLGQLLGKGNLLLALPLIFLLGLALNLTPCVYPIIPITIGYFGSQANQSGRRPVVLAIFYVLGMALMYSVLGVTAGLTGSLFGNQLQNPVVLLVFALVMFALALSQFDRPNGMPIWEFQLPAGLRNRAQARSGALGAVLMGLMVGVVAAPCIGPAVVALLQWVGAQRSPVLGFTVFFTLALGLGLPYLFLAALSGSVKRLPRSGEWMIGVKHIFGVLMIWMGFFYLQTMLNRLAPNLGLYVQAGVTALGGVYLLFLDRAGAQARVFFAAKRALGAVALVFAVLLARPAPAEAIRWQPYSDTAVAQARAQGKKILIDFTAAWCAACKELEHYTFSDPTVGAAARDYVALRSDMTNFNGPEAQKLVRQFGIAGLPTVARLVPSENAVASR